MRTSGSIPAACACTTCARPISMCIRDRGMTALPAVKAGGDSYSYTWFEQAWIPAGAEHLDAAKQFVAYLYSCLLYTSRCV